MGVDDAKGFILHRSITASPIGTVAPRSTVRDPEPPVSVALVEFAAPKLEAALLTDADAITATALPLVAGIIHVLRSMMPVVLHTAVGAWKRDGFL